MKFVFFNNYSLGLVRGGEIVGLHEITDKLSFSNPQDLLQQIILNFEELRPKFQEIIAGEKGTPLAQVNIKAPVPYPGKLLCAVRNYKEDGQIPPQEQDFFLKSPSSVIGDRSTVVLPPVKATIFHHEAELAVVIGKTASNVKRKDAMNYIFGYTPFIDVSARGLNPDGRLSFFLMKSWETFGPMGPYLITADEIKDPQNLRIQIKVNEELRQDFSTSDMAHPIDLMIEFLSSIVTLEPGDVIATGTNHQALGALQDGDEMVLEIEDLGRLTVFVKDDMKRQWERGIDEETAKRVKETATGFNPRNNPKT